MFKIKNGSIPDAFWNKFHLISFILQRTVCAILNLQYRHVDHVYGRKS